jgi:hypothetical protein
VRVSKDEGPREKLSDNCVRREMKLQYTYVVVTTRLSNGPDISKSIRGSTNERNWAELSTVVLLVVIYIYIYIACPNFLDQQM